MSICHYVLQLCLSLLTPYPGCHWWQDWRVSAFTAKITIRYYAIWCYGINSATPSLLTISPSSQTTFAAQTRFFFPTALPSPPSFSPLPPLPRPVTTLPMHCGSQGCQPTLKTTGASIAPRQVGRLHSRRRRASPPLVYIC